MSKLTVRNSGGHARAVGCIDLGVQLGGSTNEKAGGLASNMNSRAPLFEAPEEDNSDGEGCLKSYILGKTGSFCLSGN